MAGMYPELYDIVSVDTRSFNARKVRYPELIFIPKNEQEIGDILREARRLNKKIAVRCGGHSYASYGLGGSDGAWVIDVQRFNKVEPDIEGKFAHCGAGNRLGRVALQLVDRAGRAIPHGLCPRVGIAGHALHGGFGYSSRNWGLALDSIEALHVILPDGRRIWTSRHVEPDLFWALCGAGSSFGIVTEFKMRLQRAPENCIHYWYTWKGKSENPKIASLPDAETLTKIHQGFQEFVHKDIRKELAIRMRYLADYTECTGAFWGTHAEFNEAIQPLLDAWTAAGVEPDTALVNTDETRQQAKNENQSVNGSAVHQRTWREMLLYMANDDHLQQSERVAMSTLSPRDYKLNYLEFLLDEALSLLELELSETTICPKEQQEEVIKQRKDSLQAPVSNAPTSRSRGGQSFRTERDDDFPELVKGSLSSINDEFFATSLCIEERITEPQATKLFEYITEANHPEGYFWFLLIDTYGGKNSSIKNGANKELSCYSFRDHMHTCQFYINIDKKYTGTNRASWSDAINWLHGMRDTIMKNSDPNFKVYMCYIDPEDRLEGDDKAPVPLSYYYGEEQYEKLRRLKEHYDPTHMLWNPQSVGAEFLRPEDRPA